MTVPLYHSGRNTEMLLGDAHDAFYFFCDFVERKAGDAGTLQVPGGDGQEALRRARAWASHY